MKQILVFVMFSSILVWLMFAPIYKHIIIVRQAVLQKEVDVMLEIGANGSHGYIDAAMVAESKQRLEQRGFDPAELQYTVTAASGSDGSDPNAPIERGIGIQLSISYPYLHLFDIDQLLGMTPPAQHSRMSAFGLKMSEYVPR